MSQFAASKHGFKAAAVVVILLALMPSAYLAWQWRDGSQVGIYHDDSLYYVTAKSIAEGNGYRAECLPGAPVQTKYPPVLPLLLAGVWQLNPHYPDNLPLAVLLCWCFLPLMLLAAWLWYAEIQLDWRLACVLVVWLALNPVVVTFSLLFMSELLFSALLLFTVVAAERASAREGAMKWAVAAGVLAAITTLTRSAGLPLLFTVPLVFGFRCQWRNATVFMVTMLPAVAVWQLWKSGYVPDTDNQTVMYYRSYLAYHFANTSLGDLLTVIPKNLVSLIEAIGKLVLFTFGAVERSAIFLRILAFVAVSGIVRLTLRTKAWHLAAYATVFALILLQWHFPPDDRFLVPLAPLVLAGFLTELQHLGKQARATWQKGRNDQRVAAAAIVTVVLIAGPLLILQRTATGLADFIPSVLGTQRQVLERNRGAYQWIRDNTPESARFIAYDDPLLYLNTGRQAIGLRVAQKHARRHDEPAINDTLNSVPEFAKELGLQYGMFTPFDYRLTDPAVFEISRHRFEQFACQPTFSDRDVFVCVASDWKRLEEKAD